jgi:hypothetical protein
VLGLLLLIIALVVAAILVVRYLRTRPVAAHPAPLTSFRPRLSHQAFDQLDLPGVIQVVRREAVNLLG